MIASVVISVTLLLMPVLWMMLLVVRWLMLRATSSGISVVIRLPLISGRVVGGISGRDAGWCHPETRQRRRLLLLLPEVVRGGGRNWTAVLLESRRYVFGVVR